MKSCNIQSALFIAFISLSLQSVGRMPEAKGGVLDLRKIENKEKFVLQLNGEWEFYWNKMLHPHDFEEPAKYKPDCFVKVPSYWTDYSPKQVKTTGMGYATYKL